MQVGSTVVHAERSGDLRKAIEAGRKIIITTVQKFPYILDDIGKDHRDRTFAIVIDEAHSSQGGKTAAAVSMALSSGGAAEDDETVEDTINRIIESKKMLPNASYFAFTATPKNKTLQMFGEPFPHDGETGYRPFHSYTMKQATQERFIVDVLENYTPVPSYYKLMKTIEDDPEFDTKRASKKLRAFVEGNEHAIRLKAEIMVDHFHSQVIAKHKIGGQARAMVVTSTIPRCIEYFHAISAYLAERKSPYKAIVAFSGEHEYRGIEVTEASLNGFPSKDIADQIREDPYRILVCADKFQTGYDEPLLHTMYVDKTLSSVKAVQTLSRLNRAHPAKHDAFVLDFANTAEDIERAFADYYRTTVLSQETDPNKLHDLVAELNGYGIYQPEAVDQFVELYLAGTDRDQLDPILDACVAEYIELPDEDDQVAFKGSAKAFMRTYNFLSTVLPFGNPTWEKLSIFLDHLIPKLPAPREDDLSAGILETVDMESYRVEKREAMKIALADEEGELEPVPAAGGGHVTDPELDRLSSILQTFNDQFGNIDWTDADRVQRLITEEIPRKVAEDEAYQNAQKNNDPANARVEHDRALGRVMMALFSRTTPSCSSSSATTTASGVGCLMRSSKRRTASPHELVGRLRRPTGSSAGREPLKISDFRAGCDGDTCGDTWAPRINGSQPTSDPPIVTCRSDSESLHSVLKYGCSALRRLWGSSPHGAHRFRLRLRLMVGVCCTNRWQVNVRLALREADGGRRQGCSGLRHERPVQPPKRSPLL